MDNLKMLPEYLFMVGHSMQDISRDDFPLLNGVDAVSNSTDKDMCPTLISRIQNISPINPSALYMPKQFNAEDNPVQTYAAVKLEDACPIDLFPTHPSTWQQHPMNTNHDLAQHRLTVHTHNNRFDHNNTKLLLQGSDDPLISHGANNVLSHDDEHPADFAKCLIAAPAVQHPNSQERLRLSAQQQQEQMQQRPVKSGCSNLTKQQLKVKANLMSARNQQQQIQINNALLNSSSSSLPSTSQKPQRNPKVKKKAGNIVKLRFHHQALPPEYLSHYEATQGQVRTSKSQQKLTTSQQRNPTKPTLNQPKQTQSKNSHENVRSWLQKIAEIQRTANASKEGGNQIQQQQQHQQQSHHVQSQTQKDTEKTNATQQISNRQHLDINNNHPKTQNRHLHNQNQASSTSYAANMSADKNSNGGYLYSDLPYMGEITLDNCKPRRGRKPKKADICHLIYKNYGTILPKKPETLDCPSYANGTLSVKNHPIKPDLEEQPLNLCLRDQPADSYSISSGDEISETHSSCPTPISTVTPSDFVRDSMLANNLKNSLSNLSDKVKLDGTTLENVPVLANKLSTNSIPEDNVLHPVTMYYQKLLESGVLLHNANGPFKTIQKDNQLSLKIPIPSGFFLPHRVDKSTSSPAPSHLDYPEPLSTPSSIKSENSLTTTNSSSAANQQLLAPQKRKRSAIFIPPMNTENTTNPATEVSICKFKFTGGSKPTLQEKKMLSVDAGGNYRYFSGTGDKSTRGYEYFPRESLQQTAGLLPGVNCTGQKLLIDIPPPSAGLSNELLHIPESPTSSMLLSANSSNVNALADVVSTKSPAAGQPFEVSKNEACSNIIVENSTYPSSSPNTSSTTNSCVAPRKKHAALQQQLQRKCSQREKLEKTFKEQGFLIQTQQLESAEGATYCKFRQLKKFTRYLFRNWKDYLPDDLQQSTNAAALAAAAAAAEFSTNQENPEDTSVNIVLENAITCGEENIID